MKKKINLLVSLTLVLTLGLSACGSLSTTAPTSAPTTAAAQATTAPVATAPVSAPTTVVPKSTTAASAPATTAATVQFPLTINDSVGNKITLAKPAERIACLTIECVDILKELGLVPLAAQFTLFQMESIFNLNKLYGDKAKDIGQLRPNGFQYDLEQLAQLKPDMIVGSKQAVEATKPESLKVAVYTLDYNGYELAIENLKNFGKITGKTVEADKAAQKFLDKLAAYKAKSPKDKSAMIISSISNNRFNINHVGTPSCALLNELGKCPWKVPAGGGSTVPYSLEQILQDDPDFIFIRSRKDAASVKAMEEMQSSPIWKELKAVKNKQVYEGDFYVMAQSMGTFLLGEFLDYTMTTMYPNVFPKPVTVGTSSTPSSSSASTATQYPLTVTDATGTSITLAKKPERIVCLTRACMDFQAELEVPMVGISKGYYLTATDARFFGDKAKTFAQINATGSQVNAEEIVALKPDLIVSGTAQADQRDAFRSAAPLYIIADTKNPTGVIEELKKYAKVLGVPDKAETVAKRFTDKLAAMKMKAPRNLSVMAMVSYNDTTPQLIATDQSTLCATLNEIAKCEWKAPSSLLGYGPVSLEAILQNDPQVLFVMTIAAGPKDWQPQAVYQNEANKKAAIIASPVWKDISAVKNNRIYEVDLALWGGDVGTRMLGLILDEAANKLYPDVFPKTT